MLKSNNLAAKIEAFDSFWEGPKNVEKGYRTFYKFYKNNYLKRLPEDKNVNILVISCGPGYFVNLLVQHGYLNVLGIDSDPEKVEYALKNKLNCKTVRAFEFLHGKLEEYDVIFCEQEVNHLEKFEIIEFLKLCRNSLKKNGRLFIHALNGANPITGAEALAQNFNHYNTFTEYAMRQLLVHSGFQRVSVFPLNLYVFYSNPLNYVLIVVSMLYTAFFRLSFILYGKANKIFTKKIGAVCVKVAEPDIT